MNYHILCAFVSNSAVSIIPNKSYKQPANKQMHPLNEDAFSVVEDPSWGGRYSKKASQSEETNQYHIQEATDAMH